VKIGIFTDGLGNTEFEPALDWIASQGIEAVEIGTGGFSPIPHCDPETLLGDASSRDSFKSAIESRGLTISALNCNCNPLDPGGSRGETADKQLRGTIELAKLLGVEVVVTMSGCPGDPGGSTYPNWVAHPWQEEFAEILKWQWEQKLAPYWKTLSAFAAEREIKIAIEMHPGQCVFNTRTLLLLRDIAGPNVGANLDPSHLFYQGMDPGLVIRTFGEGVIHHVHAKDARIDSHEAARTGLIDTRDMELVNERSWSYRTLGFGHGELFWREFVSALRSVGFDGVLSLEHEDPLMSANEGIQKSVEFLKPIIIRTQPEATPPWIKE
jgi:sugar phosphate isomerase/epimerase